MINIETFYIFQISTQNRYLLLQCKRQIVFCVPRKNDFSGTSQIWILHIYGEIGDWDILISGTDYLIKSDSFLSWLIKN